MIDQINQLIAINLQLFFAVENKQLKLKDFRNIEGHQITGAKMLADIMQQKELIQQIPTTETLSYELTELGRNICLHGGWEKHLERQNKLNATIKAHTIPVMKHQKKKSPILIMTLIAMVLALIILYGL